MAEVEYIDCGDYYICKVDGSPMRCVSCQKPKEYSKETKLCKHKCSKAHENRRMGAHRAQEKSPAMFRKKTWGQRLTDGFAFLRTGRLP